MMRLWGAKRHNNRAATRMAVLHLAGKPATPRGERRHSCRASLDGEQELPEQLASLLFFFVLFRVRFPYKFFKINSVIIVYQCFTWAGLVMPWRAVG